MLKNEHPHGTIPDFWDRAQDDLLCYELLKETRWPDGFVCPKCSGQKGYHLKKKGIYTYRCANRACRYQCSLTAKTAFHGTRVPLRKWFMTLFHMGSNQSGCSTNAISKLIGVTYKTTLRMTTKLRSVMENANAARFMNALLVAIQSIVTPKEGPEIVADVLVQKEELVMVDGYAGEDYCKPDLVKKTEKRDILKIHYRKPRLRSKADHRNKSIMQLSAETDPEIIKVLVAAKTHLNRFLLGTYHRNCYKFFPLYLAEFVYRFNEPNPAAMLRQLVSDCIKFG